MTSIICSVRIQPLQLVLFTSLLYQLSCGVEHTTLSDQNTIHIPSNNTNTITSCNLIPQIKTHSPYTSIALKDPQAPMSSSPSSLSACPKLSKKLSQAFSLSYTTYHFTVSIHCSTACLQLLFLHHKKTHLQCHFCTQHKRVVVHCFQRVRLV